MRLLLFTCLAVSLVGHSPSYARMDLSDSLQRLSTSDEPPDRDLQSDDEQEILIVEPLRDYVFAFGRRVQHPSTISSTVTVIDTDALDRSQITLASDALRLAPGVAVARNGGPGGFASARIRGGSSGQTLVVIDGVVVNDAAAPQGGFNFGNLDVADIQQIEVLRGPQGLVWGADAIGGVIYLETKDWAPGISGYVEGGSQGLFRSGASLFAERGGSTLRATVSGARTDGVSRAATGTEKDGYRSIAGSLRGQTSIGRNNTLTLTARLSDSRTDLDGFPPPDFTFADTDEIEDATDYAVAASFEHGVRTALSGSLTLSASGIDRRTSDNGAATFEANGNRHGARYAARWRAASDLSLTAGSEMERVSAQVSGVDESALSGGVFAMVEVTPTPDVMVSAGVRRDEFSNFEGATTSRVAGVWTVREDGLSATRLRASWGQGYRAPTLFELNFDRFGIIPNPDLAPERASGFDVGVEQTLDGGRTRFAATFFRQRVKDQIDFDFAGNGYFNIDRVKSTGVELEALVGVTETVDAQFIYSLIEATDADTGVRILRTPKHSGSAALYWRATERLLLSADARFNGREADTPTPNDSFVRLDLRANWSLTDEIELYGRVENATDTDYQDVSGYGEAGRSFFFGVRLGA